MYIGRIELQNWKNFKSARANLSLLRIWNINGRTRAAWLKRISSVLSQAVPQLKSLEVDMDDQGAPHLVGRYEHWRPHDAKGSTVAEGPAYTSEMRRFVEKYWDVEEAAKNAPSLASCLAALKTRLSS